MERERWREKDRWRDRGDSGNREERKERGAVERWREIYIEIER